jgi:SAM-dependent methyltransferase
LLECVPAGAERVVDVACGMAWSAHVLLPARSTLLYVGVDRDPARVDTAFRSMRGTPYADRVAVRQGAPEALPLPDASVDVVISLMALQRCADTQVALAETARVLRPGGRLVVAEPDGLGQQFYFDGHLGRFNQSFQRLCAAVDDTLGGDAGPLSRPGIALGPSVGGRMEAGGFHVRPPRLHLVQTSQRETIDAFARRLRAHAEAMRHTGALAADHPAVYEVEQVVRVLEVARGQGAAGMAVHVLPTFLWVGVKG